MKMLFGLLITLSFSVNLYAKKVAFCTTYIAGANIEMKCSGDIEGKYTPVQLYHKGWSLKTDISGANSFILVFEK